MTGDFTRGIATMIWSMVVLSDSTVVTGDNRGHVHIWDGSTGVLMLTIHQHAADVLSLAVSPDENQIFASGVDSRVSCIQRIANGAISDAIVPSSSSGDSDVVIPEPKQSRSPSESHWIYSTSHRPHSHDIFALAVCANDSGSSKRGHKNGPLLISGGLDCKMCVYSVDDFAKTRPSWVLPVPAKGLVQNSTDYSKVVMRHRHRVDIWSLTPLELSELPPSVLNSNEQVDNQGPSTKKPKRGKSKASDADSVDAPVPVRSGSHKSDTTQALSVVAPNLNDRCKLSLNMNLKGVEHIHCTAFSPDGRLLAVSRQSGTKVWKFDYVDEGQTKVTVVSLPAEIESAYCHSICFSIDSRRLALASSSGQLYLLEVAQEELEAGAPTSSESDADTDSDSEGDANVTSSKEHHKKLKLGARFRHVFDHAQSVRQYLRTAAPAEKIEESLCQVVSSMAFSGDGCYLAVTDSVKNVYVYELDR